LEQLLADPQRRTAMGAAGRRAVSQSFTAQRHVEALVEAYDRARLRREARDSRHELQAAELTPAGAP
jgi:hypothetical protein